MKIIAMALAASTMLAMPAVGAAQGNAYAYGKDPKVCLVTFESEAALASQANVGVTKAQYLPLRIALRFESQNDALADIYTYNADGTQVAGVDYNYAPAAGMDTESTCAYLDSLNDDDGDDD